MIKKLQSFKVTLGELSYPIGNILIDRTAFAAQGHLAVQTTLRLTDGLGDRIVFKYFLKLFHLIYSVYYFISR